jgi:ADP-heptose:LPS heptosyltransferase
VELYRARWGTVHERGDPYFSANFSPRRPGFQVNEEPTCLTHTPCPQIERESIRRILAVKLDHVGDVILALPGVRRLRELFPEAEITFLVGPHARHVAEAEPCVDRVLVREFYRASSLHQPRKLTPEQRREIRDWLAGFRFDLAVDLRREMDTREFIRLSGARYTAGFGDLGQAEWLTIAVPCEGVIPVFKPRRHISQDPLRLVAMIEQAMTAPPPLTDLAPVDVRPEAAELLAASLPLDKRLVIGIHPGSGRAVKCWPAPSFGRLAGMFADRLGAVVVLFAGSDEVSLAQQVLRNVPSGMPVVSLAGKLNLSEMAVALRRCDLFVGNDSGPTHLAATTGMPVLGVYAGAADPVQWGPIGPNAAAIQRAMLCSPCYLSHVRHCPLGVPCTKELHPEQVFEAALRLLLPRWQKLPAGLVGKRGVGKKVTADARG